MKTRSIAAAAACGAILASAMVDPVAAGSCVSVRPGNNPAFAEPRPCPTKTVPRPAAKPAATTAGRATEVRRENGRSIYRHGDTTIAIGGSVTADVVVGRGRMRP